MVYVFDCLDLLASSCHLFVGSYCDAALLLTCVLAFHTWQIIDCVLASQQDLQGCVTGHLVLTWASCPAAAIAAGSLRKRPPALPRIVPSPFAKSCVNV